MTSVKYTNRLHMANFCIYCFLKFRNRLHKCKTTKCWNFFIKFIPLWLIVLGVLLILLAVTIGWGALPYYYHKKILQQAELRPDTSQFERFVELPYVFTFRIYIFHVINPELIIQGYQPEVQEIGPFIYRQKRQKQILDIYEEERTIVYNERLYFTFDQTASGELKETDEVTIINPALNAAFQNREFHSSINAEWKQAFHTDSLFLTVSVKDLLFQGYRICGPEVLDLNICKKILSTHFHKQFRADKDTIYFSFFNDKNSTDGARFSIHNGIHDIIQLGSIVRIQGDEYLRRFWDNEFVWGGGKSLCNRVRGKHFTLYPPFIEKDKKITIFCVDICRKVDMIFSEECFHRGICGYKFALNEDTLISPSTTGEHMCYCLKKSTGIDDQYGCLKNGLLDLYNCFGAPFLLSWPHFLWADKDYQTSTIGVNPNEKLHKTFILIEPDTGIPLLALRRIQFNMFIKPVDGIQYLADVRTSLIPIIWFEEELDIGNETYHLLYDGYITKRSVMKICRWLFVIIGIVIFVATISVLIFKKKHSTYNSDTVTWESGATNRPILTVFHSTNKSRSSTDSIEFN